MRSKEEMRKKVSSEVDATFMVENGKLVPVKKWAEQQAKKPSKKDTAKKKK